MTSPRKKSPRKQAAPKPGSPSPPSGGAVDTPAERAATPPRPDQMDEEVVDFITAIEEYKRLNQRPFPNWSEILEVLKALGYVRSR